MTVRISDVDLSRWLAAANKASSGRWSLGITPADREQARRRLIECFDGSPGDRLHMVCAPLDGDIERVLLDGEDVRVTAMTGNGPDSEANARFIALSSPNNIRCLIADLANAREDLSIANDRVIELGRDILDLQAQLAAAEQRVRDLESLL